MVQVVSAAASQSLQPRVHMEFQMKNLIARFVKDESGATAIEYGLIAAGIALAVIVAVKSVGTNLNGTFSAVASGVTAP